MTRSVMEGVLVEGGSHGTITGYATHKCRCQPCRRANAEYTRNRAASIKQRLQQLEQENVQLRQQLAVATGEGDQSG